MRLTELSSNKRSFKTVTFNRSGLSLIVGKHSGVTRELTSTYNGVGKSLVVALINYCLGSNKNKAFDEHLDGWQFTLKFEHEGVAHAVSRWPNTTKIQFDGNEISITKFRKELSALNVFELPASDVNYLTLRSLMSFFLRSRRSSYVDYAKPVAKWTDYQSVLCQSFLLGLDTKRVTSKHESKKKLDEQLALANRYKQDSELRSYYLGDRNAEVELVEIGAEIEKVAGNLAEFKVADDYAIRQENADSIHSQKLDATNKKVLLRNQLADIEAALKIKPDVSPERLVAVYEESKIALPELVSKRLEQVQDFYKRLHENRLKRLADERKEIEKEIVEIVERTEKLSKLLDSELQYLNAHKALDEYTENNRYLSELISKRSRIEDYLNLLANYTEEAQKIKVELGQANLETGKYLSGKQTADWLGTLMETFRGFAQRLYGAIASGLVIKNDDGENQTRFKIDAHIPYDQADGINQGKIFCFDLLLLKLQKRHSVKFLFHDNRLFADMDPNQRYSLVQTANEIAVANDFQYIASVKEDAVDSVREVAGEDFEDLFINSRILELDGDAGGAGKLLGIQVDMKYDE